jgi:hypothetical protein
VSRLLRAIWPSPTDRNAVCRETWTATRPHRDPTTLLADRPGLSALMVDPPSFCVPDDRDPLDHTPLTVQAPLVPTALLVSPAREFALKLLCVVKRLA